MRRSPGPPSSVNPTASCRRPRTRRADYFAPAHAADLRNGALWGFHRHRACASLSIASTTDPEEPVGTRYATRGYLIVATSISSNNLSALRRRRDGPSSGPGPAWSHRESAHQNAPGDCETSEL